MRAPSKYLFGIFLISFSTLLFEISLTRVFSVTLWYHFGFLIISTAMLGFGVSGVVLSLWDRARNHYDADRMLSGLASLLSLSIIFSFWLLQKIPFDPFSLYTDKLQLLYMPVTYILVAIPFFFSGLSLSFLFTRYPADISRLYGFDLLGAALGCIAVIVTMPVFGGGGSVLFSAVLSAFAIVLFSYRKLKFFLSFGLALLIISAFLSLRADSIIPLRLTAAKSLGSGGEKSVFTRWNSFSRIDLYLDTSYYDSQKLAPTFIVDQGTAATGLDFDLRPDVRTALRQFPSDTLYPSCLAYINKSRPSVLVIGSGCGTQVLDALHHAVKKVVAVEINPIINEVVGTRMNDLWGNLFHQPEVQLVTDEGRNYVRSSHELYDAIVSVHTISNAALASGALNLAENYVLTREAFADYYDHLTDSGMIYFTRPEFQLPRLFATGREVLEEHGVKDCTGHFFSYTYPAPKSFAGRKAFYSIFMMSKNRMDKALVNRMKSFVAAIKDNDREPIFLYDPFIPYHNIYDSILQTRDLNALYKQYPFEISPATDDKPFFNHHTRWSAINRNSFADIFSQRMGRLALEDEPIAEVTLIMLLAQVLVISAIFILLPLWKFSGKRLSGGKIFPWLFYFSGLGAGFIMVEITMIQQFGLLLGEPVYTIAIVLASLLVFTGLGAYLSKRYASHAKRSLKISISMLAFLLILASLVLPSLFRAAIALSMSWRIGLAVMIMLPFGLLLGLPFPLGIQLIKNENGALIPWAWGVNGFFTVIGSVVALILGMMLGFRVVLWIAAAIYVLSILMIHTTRANQVTK